MQTLKNKGRKPQGAKMKNLTKKQIAKVREVLRVTKANKIHGSIDTVAFAEYVNTVVLAKEKIHYQFWSGTGRNMTLAVDGMALRHVDFCKAIGYEFADKNDAPRGGAVGEYIVKKGNRTKVDFFAVCIQCGIGVTK